MTDLAAALKEESKAPPKKKPTKAAKKAKKPAAKKGVFRTPIKREAGGAKGYGYVGSTVYQFPKAGRTFRKAIYFREDEWEALRQLAEDRQESVTQIVREAVRGHLNIGE